MLKYIIMAFSITFFTQGMVMAQVIDPDVVRAEIKKRGYDNTDEEEILQRMKERGFDVNNLEPSRLGEYEKALEKIAKELEAEKAEVFKEEAQEIGEKVAEDQLEGVAKESAENIQDAIKDGASIDEAVSSELIEVQNKGLPSSGVYGTNLYRNNSIRLFNKNYDVKPTPDYILGVGDIVSIDIWGISEESGTYEIQQEGYIKPTRMPRINLKGVSYKKAKELVRSRFSQYYNFRAEEFELSVNYARSLNVNIYGEVFNPGSYTIPALNTGINALVAAGGPSDIGTVRNIKIISSNGQSRTMDLYQFLLDPSASKDYYLSNDDYIYVDVSRKVVEIIGAVNRPMKYELKSNENLKDLIEFSGGFKASAYQANLQVKRFENDSEKIIDLDYRSINGNFKLFPGDVVTVNEIPKPFQNFAEVSGAVELASKYQINSGTRVSDLLGKALLRNDARKDIAFLLRKNSDESIKTIQIDLEKALGNRSSTENLIILPEDKILVLSSANFTNELPIKISGAVRNPIDHPYGTKEGLKVSDAVLLANGLRKDAADFAYIFRRKGLSSLDVEYIRIDLTSAMQSANNAANIELQGGDELKIYSNLTFSDDLHVKIYGAIRQPGEYAYDPSLQLKDILSLAGGLELEASRSRIDISRISMNDDQQTNTDLITVEVNEKLDLANGGTFKLEPYDQIYIRSAPEFELQRNISFKGEVKYPGRYPLINENERLLSVISRAGGLTKEAFMGGVTLFREKDGVGYVVVDLKKAQKSPNSPFNLILQEGDFIQIPKMQELVTIQGATRLAETSTDEISSTGKISVPFESGKSVNYYVENYVAGVSENGKKRLITVEHPNGELQRTKQFLFINSYPSVRPGSTITIGYKELKESKDESKEKVDWGKVFADSVAQATSILTLVLLLSRI